MPFLGKRFSEMNQFRVGVTGLLVVLMVVAVSVNVGKLRGSLFGTAYTAAFAESGGLRSGDDVRVAGLTIGTVEDVGIKGTSVSVSFNVEGIKLGNKTTAAIKSDNALGRKFVQIVPGGTGFSEDIPLERTTAPYGVTQALSDLTATTGELDVEQLAASFDSVAGMFADTPPELREALRGVSRLSSTISSRDTELQQLFEKARGVTGVLAERNQEITQLMTDGSAFFSEVQARRLVIHQLLVNTRLVSQELIGLVDDNQAQLGPALDELRGVIKLLDRNEDNLEYAIQNLGGFVRALGEAVGGGPFFYAYLQNLVPTDMAPIISDLVRQDPGETGLLPGGAP
jgi:phospholipid/cholesterol/gamma-HCH transport system substrate-binding protein